MNFSENQVAREPIHDPTRYFSPFLYLSNNRHICSNLGERKIHVGSSLLYHEYFYRAVCSIVLIVRCAREGDVGYNTFGMLLHAPSTNDSHTSSNLDDWKIHIGSSKQGPKPIIQYPLKPSTIHTSYEGITITHAPQAQHKPMSWNSIERKIHMCLPARRPSDSSLKFTRTFLSQTCHNYFIERTTKYTLLYFQKATHWQLWNSLLPSFWSLRLWMHKLWENYVKARSRFSKIKNLLRSYFVILLCSLITPSLIHARLVPTFAPVQ